MSIFYGSLVKLSLILIFQRRQMPFHIRPVNSGTGMHFPYGQFQPASPGIITDIGQMFKTLMSHRKLSLSVSAHLMNGNSHLKISLIQNFFQKIFSHVLTLGMIFLFFHLSGIPGHQAQQIVIHIFHQLLCFLRNLYLRNFHLFQIYLYIPQNLFINK